MKIRRIAALLLSGVMMASVLTGCGGVDKEAVVATFDETEIKLGVANFAARLQQANSDDFYVAYFGEKVWSTDMYGDGSTMESNMKDSVSKNLFDMYTLQAHAAEYDVAVTEEEKGAITQAAADFIAANDEKALEALGAEQSILEEYLTLATIQSKMYDAIVAEADIDVTDEEANTSAYSYVLVSKNTYTDEEGNTAEYTEEELEALAKTVTEFADKAQSETLEAAAEEYGYTVNEGTFTADDTAVNETVLTELKGLAEGEVSGVVDAESAYYVVRLDAITDAEATAETRESMIEERKETHYSDVLAAWQETHTWKVDEDVWETVKFDNLFTTILESTETEETVTTEQ